MALLDEVSGFEFEEVMVSVFQNMGYENVQASRKTADKGRDIIMEEGNQTGPPTAVIVECKHTDTVGRPVVQKLDSAVKTYEHNGAKRGMIATTGRFTDPAKEYAASVDIELMDGHDIREVGDEIGMDLYNGRIEIICDTVVNPYHPDGPTAPLQNALDDVNNLPSETIPDPRTTLTLYPVITAQTKIQREFSTSTGVISRLDETDNVLLDASREGPKLLGEPLNRVLTSTDLDTVSVEAADLEEFFDAVQERRFGMTDTEYREWLTGREVDRYTHTVTYTGGNNVTYEKTCEPSPSDVRITDFLPVYAPRVYGGVELGVYEYTMDWVVAGDDVGVIDDSIRKCVHETETGVGWWDWSLAAVRGVLNNSVSGDTYTYCPSCGAIVCPKHLRFDSVSGEEVCTDCVQTERFAGAKKFFAGPDTKREYRSEYEDLPVYAKPLANMPAVVFALLCLIFFAGIALL